MGRPNGFNIPGAGVHTITLLSILPPITDPVTIDGYTQPGASENSLAIGSNAVLLIELTGNMLTGHAIHLQGAGSSGSVIRGLVINGVFLQPFSAGASIGIDQSDNNSVIGNFIGTDPSGALLVNTSDGILIVNASANTIGGTTAAARNVIAGNGFRRVLIRAQTAPSGPQVTATNQILGNYIGTNAAGTAALGTGTAGIWLLSGGASVVMNNNVVGGSAAGAGNLISGNDIGIRMDFPSGTLVAGNLIGTNIAGTAAIPNLFAGIDMNGATNNTFGGTSRVVPHRVLRQPRLRRFRVRRGAKLHRHDDGHDQRERQR